MEWKFTIVKPDASTLVVDEPIGWDALTKVIKRDAEGHGLFFEFSETSLEFDGAGYFAIKEQYELNGVDGQLKLLIEWHCGDNVFQQYFYGPFDFSRYEETCGYNCNVKIGIDNATRELLIANRKEAAVDLTSNLAYDGTTVLTDYPELDKQLLVPAKAIQILTHAKNDGPLTTGNLVGHTQWYSNDSDGNMRAQILPGFLKILYTDIAETTFYNTIELVNGGFLNKPVGIFPVIDFKEFSQLKCVSSAVEISYRFKGSIVATPSTTGARLLIMKLPAGTDPNNFANYITLVSSAVTTTFDLGNTLSTTLVAGDKIFLYFFIKFTPSIFSSWVFNEDPECFFKISLTSICEDTTCKTALINEAASRVIEHITNNELKFKSDYYGRTDSLPFASVVDGCGSLRTITNGLYLRQALLQDGTKPKLFITFKELWESLNAVDCVGLGIEGNTVRVEPLEYFYTNDIIFTADNIDEINRSVRIDRIYNLINVGYDKWETEQYNGLDAIHTKRSYRLLISNTNTKLEKICKAILDGYAIEVTRRKTGLTEDWRYDNNMFWLCCKRVVSDIEVETGNITNPNNLFDPGTVLNYRLSPVRNLMRWFHWIMQGLRSFDNTSKLLFTSGDGNFVAEGLLPGACSPEANVLTENEDLTALKFDDITAAQPFIIPEKINFKYPVSLSDFASISSNKYGKIKYRQNENLPWSYGWIDQLRYTPEDGMAEFTLTPSKN